MSTNHHFVSIFICDVFKGRQFKNEQHFCAQVLQTGTWLGTIRVYGLDFLALLPTREAEQQIKDLLNVPYQPVDMFDCMLVVSESLKKQWVIDGWFRRRKVFSVKCLSI